MLLYSDAVTAMPGGTAISAGAAIIGGMMEFSKR
jgi:hypothetical protein